MLVNAGEWPDAEAEFGNLREMVRAKYGFDLEDPETIPLVEAVPLDRVLNLVEARSYIEQFIFRIPANIVSLLYFRGALALHTGRPREALPFFQAAGSIGVVARSLQHTLANDGETEDLFKRSFLLAVLALADFSPDEALIELARVLEDEPPPGMPGPLWAYTAEEQHWLLGVTFVRLVDRGFAQAAARVFERVCDRSLAAYGVELRLPGWHPGQNGSVATNEHAAVLRAQAHPAGWARILFAKGLLDLNAGDPARALPYIRLAAALIEAEGDPAPDPSRGDAERAALCTRGVDVQPGSAWRGTA
jgi:hypothetical protein